MRNAICWLVLAAMVLALPAVAGAQTGGAKADPAVEKALMDLERKLNDAVAKRDVTTFTTLVTADAWSVDPMGMSPVAEFVKMLKDPKVDISIKSHELTDMKVIQLDANAAVVTYKWTGTGTWMGEPLPSPTLSSTVWAKRGDKWLAMFHQETIMMPPPAQK